MFTEYTLNCSCQMGRNHVRPIGWILNPECELHGPVGLALQRRAEEIASLGYSKIALTGQVNSGKTALSRAVSAIGGFRIGHCDTLMGPNVGWSDVSEAASRWFSESGKVLVEGTQVPRALRKWLEANPEGSPCGAVIFLNEQLAPCTNRQVGTGKGAATVLNNIAPELQRRGVDLYQTEATLAQRVASAR